MLNNVELGVKGFDLDVSDFTIEKTGKMNCYDYHQCLNGVIANEGKAYHQ